MKRHLILLLIVFGVLQSCRVGVLFGIKNYNTLSDGGVRPKKHQFSLDDPPYQLKDIKLIDTNAVYLNMHTNGYLGPERYDTIYYVYRFFNNGKVFKSYAYHNLPNNVQCNNLTYGYIGYYEVEDNKIKIEIFSLHDYGSYNFTYGYIYDDRIILTHWKPRTPLTFKLKLDEILVKYKVGSVNTKPDW